MILYFSGTGNSRHLAELIGRQAHERVCDMAELMRSGTTVLCLSAEERLGWVFPTHFWGMPALVREFVSRVSFSGYAGQYCFAAVTYGMVCGNPHGQLRSLLRDKGIGLNASFSVRMVDVWTPLFNLTDKARSLRITQAAIPVMERVARAVADKRRAKRISCLPPLIADAVHKIMYQRHRPTSPFHTTDSCIACRLCADSCPANAIEMNAGRPMWVTGECTLCLRCLHHCPRFAIQYGPHTHRHGQFVNPYV